MTVYDPEPTRVYCEQLELDFSLEDWQAFVDRAIPMGFKQEQVDFAMREHAFRMKYLFDFYFNPKSYTPLQRIKVALHFLNPFAKKR